MWEVGRMIQQGGVGAKDVRHASQSYCRAVELMLFLEVASL